MVWSLIIFERPLNLCVFKYVCYSAFAIYINYVRNSKFKLGYWFIFTFTFCEDWENGWSHELRIAWYHTPSPVTWPAGHVTSHSIIIEYCVTWSKHLGVFQLCFWVINSFIHFESCWELLMLLLLNDIYPGYAAALFSGGLVEVDISPGVLELLEVLLACYLLLNQTCLLNVRTMTVSEGCIMGETCDKACDPGWDWAGWLLLGTGDWVLLLSSANWRRFLCSRFAPLHFSLDTMIYLVCLGRYKVVKCHIPGVWLLLPLPPVFWGELLKDLGFWNLLALLFLVLVYLCSVPSYYQFWYWPLNPWHNSHLRWGGFH